MSANQPPPKNRIWAIHPPPATKLFQQMDGSWYIEFQPTKQKMDELVAWAQLQLDTFSAFRMSVEMTDPGMEIARKQAGLPPSIKMVPATKVETKPVLAKTVPASLASDPGYAIAMAQMTKPLLSEPESLADDAPPNKTVIGDVMTVPDNLQLVDEPESPY